MQLFSVYFTIISLLIILSHATSPDVKGYWSNPRRSKFERNGLVYGLGSHLAQDGLTACITDPFSGSDNKQGSVNIVTRKDFKSKFKSKQLIKGWGNESSYFADSCMLSEDGQHLFVQPFTSVRYGDNKSTLSSERGQVYHYIRDNKSGNYELNHTFDDVAQTAFSRRYTFWKDSLYIATKESEGTIFIYKLSSDSKWSDPTTIQGGSTYPSIGSTGLIVSGPKGDEILCAAASYPEKFTVCFGKTNENEPDWLKIQDFVKPDSGWSHHLQIAVNEDTNRPRIIINDVYAQHDVGRGDLYIYDWNDSSSSYNLVNTVYQYIPNSDDINVQLFGHAIGLSADGSKLYTSAEGFGGFVFSFDIDTSGKVTHKNTWRKSEKSQMGRSIFCSYDCESVLMTEFWFKSSRMPGSAGVYQF